MQQSISFEEKLTLSGVKKDFDHWRATREKRGKIPDLLRNKVKALLDHYPSTKISRTLGVNPSLIASNFRKDIKFVEAHPGIRCPDALSQASDYVKNACCEIEIHRPNGDILKVRSFPMASLAAVITQFVGA